MHSLVLPNRNLLAYPAGVPPGFDSSHVAARNTKFSAVIMAGSAISLAPGLVSPGTVGTINSTPTFTIDGIMGPCMLPGASGYVSFPATQAASQPCTMAAIISSGAFVNAGILGNYTSGAAGQVLAAYSLRLYFSTAQNIDIDSGIRIDTPDRFFVAASCAQDAGSALNFIVMNLSTGVVTTVATTHAGALGTGNSYSIGKEFEYSTVFPGKIAAVMHSYAFMSMTALRQWAADPWSFWYPQVKQRYYVKGGITAYSSTADAGAYNFTGTAATLQHSDLIGADAGSYAFTGTAATLKLGHLASAGAGSYAFTGTSATLKLGRLASAGAGSYAFTGQDATLTYAPAAGVFTLAAGTGTYNFTGTPATLTYVPSRPPGGGWLSEEQLERHDEWRKKRRKQAKELEDSIRAAYQRLTGKTTPPPVIVEAKGDPEVLAESAKRLSTQLIAKSQDSARLRTRNAQIIADLNRLANEVIELERTQALALQMEEEAIVMLLLQ